LKRYDKNPANPKSLQEYLIYLPILFVPGVNRSLILNKQSTISFLYDWITKSRYDTIFKLNNTSCYLIRQMFFNLLKLYLARFKTFGKKNMSTTMQIHGKNK